MFALIAAILAALYAFGVRPDEVDFAWLALAFFFLHFAIEFALPAVGHRHRD